MKVRLWVLVCVLIAAVLGLSLYMGWRWMGVHQRMESLFLARITALSGARVQVRDFHLGLGYVRFGEMTMVDEERGLSLTIEQAHLGFSSLDYITSGFRFRAGFKEMLISHPQLRVDLDRFLLAWRSGSAIPLPLNVNLPERITIVKGSVILLRAGDHRLSEISEFDGWLEMTVGQRSSFRLTGCWEGQGTKNLLVSGILDPQLELLSLQAELKEANLAQVLGPALPTRYTIDGGLLRFSMIVNRDHQTRESKVLGKLELEASSLVDEGLDIRLEDLWARARLDGMDLEVGGIEARIGGGKVQVHGRIINLPRPTFHLSMEASGLKSEQMLLKIFGENHEYMPCGSVDLRGELEGSGKNLAFQGRLSARQLEVAGHRLDDLRARMKVQGSQIQVSGLRARLPWAVIGCQGKLDIARSPAVLEVEWRLEEVDLAEACQHLGFIALKGEGVLAGRLSGPVGAPYLRGGLRLSRLKMQWLPVEKLNGQFFWGGGRLSYRLGSPDGQVVLEGGGTGLSRNSSHQAILRVWNIPLGEMLSGQRIGAREARFSGRWIFSGSVDQAKMFGKLELERDPGAKGCFHSWAEFFRQQEGRWCLQARTVSPDWEVSGIPMAMKINFYLDGQQLKLRELNFNDQLKMFGEMERDDQRRLSGQLTFSRVDAQWLCGFLSTIVATNQLEGLVSGRVTLAGNTRSPEAWGYIEGIQGRLARLDDLSLQVPLRLRHGTLHLGSSLLSHQDQQLMVLEGKIDAGGAFSIQTRGEQIEAKTLARLFKGTSPKMEGLLSYQCRLEGSTLSPVIEGRLHWVQGQLRMMKFDDFWVSFRGQKNKLRLEQLSMVKKDQRKISITGSVPYTFLGFKRKPGQEEELDLSVQVEGDVLSLLPSFTSQVKRASGSGEASFRLGGGPGSLVLGSGRLRLRGGWIEPMILVKRLENLNGWVEIDEEDHFARIKEMTGTIEGNSLEVVNFRELNWGRRRLESLRISGLGLDLGILGVRTGPEGIELNIPGLMDRGETGRIRITGANLKKPLILAGPLESPEIMGCLGLNHTNFTYPPISNQEGELLSFLKRIRWDLTVMALKDVWFENDVAALRVKGTQSKMRFVGSAEDGTLRVMGHAEADRGEVTYLDRQFQVVKLDLKFEGHEKTSLGGYDNRPIVSGKFETTVYAESTGVATDIYITIYVIDPETGERTLQGKWGDFKLELSSSDPSDDTQEKILDKLGYTGDYAEKVLQLLQLTLGPKLEDYFIRPVFEPVERTIKRTLGIDVIRLRAGLTRNLLVQDERPQGAYESLSRRLFLPHSSLLIGKYLTDSCFLSYMCQFRTRTDEFMDDRLGIMHRLGLEFCLKGSTILDLEYDYERDLTEGDKKVWISSSKKIQITHSFPF